MRIHAIDDSGQRFGPVSLSLGANATVHFNSRDLENGNSVKGLSAGVGDGTGDWRLELDSELDIEPLAYMRTSDGFVTSLHDIVQGEFVPGIRGLGSRDDSIRHHVRTFNPASNTNQVSHLRLINTAGVENTVAITGLDDEGRPPESEVRLTLPAYGARTLTAQELEQGAAGLEGRFGDGDGKWQLFISSLVGPERSPAAGPRPIQVMSLLFSRPPGNLTNLSSVGAGNDPHRGGPGTDWLSGGRGDDILDPGDNDDAYDWILGSAGNDRIVYTDSGATAYQALGYTDLDTGVRATIDGIANQATVTKGSAGTDTIVDIVNPLNAGTDLGGFGLIGTHFDDRFTLTLDAGQWMAVRGNAGNDTIDIRSGLVKINYRHAPGPVRVDLGAGRASDDGYGNVDTIIGDVWQVEGGPGNDTLRGSAGDDRLDGGDGDDVLDPGDNDYGDDRIYGSAGNDRIVFTNASPSRAWQELHYDKPWREQAVLPAGIEATIDGPANRAMVDKGSAGTDTIVDIAKALDDGWGFRLNGTRNDDVFHLTVGDGQWMVARGYAGNDTFNVRSRSIRIDYQDAPSGIDIDLGAGRASNDGHGDVDTINGDAWEIRGTDFKDVIRGSDRDESFIGRAGDDVIDGRGGFDRLRFDRGCCGVVGGIEVDLEKGYAKGTWHGEYFSYTLSSIEYVRGGPGNDILTGGNSDDRLEGRDGNDYLIGGPGSDRLEGGDGDDYLVGGTGNENKLRGGSGDDVFEISLGRGRRGHDTIEDFTNGEDVIVLNSWNIPSHSALMAVTTMDVNGNGVWIDLSRYGGRGIMLWQFFDIDALDASDFLL